MNEINDFLRKYVFSAFQHRVFMRLSLFTYKALLPEGPPILRAQFDQRQSEHSVKQPILVATIDRNLRSGQKTVLIEPLSKYAKASFSCIFSKIREKNSYFYCRDFSKFKNSILTNLNSICSDLCNSLPIFYCLSYRKYNLKKKEKL